MTIDFRVRAARPQAHRADAPFHEWVLPDGTLWTLFHRNGADYLLRFPGLADFELSAGCQDVVCHPAPGIRDDTVQHLYLNQVQPLALGRQGKLVFHASAIESPGGALAFLGVSGRGKSTLAASFARSGSRFLTDDGLLLEACEGGYRVHPSHPSIRLWDDSREALMHEAATLAPPVPYTPKARILSDDSLAFCDTAQPLRRVYFLGDGSAPGVAIERVSPSEALIGLVNNSFLLDIAARDIIATHFHELTQLVTLPIYYRLDYPRRYSQMVQVREAILRHASEDHPAP